MDLIRAYEVAIKTAEQAGALLRQGLNEFKQVSLKSSAVDLLTQHDRASQALITEWLQTAFPDHRLVNEEKQPDAPASAFEHVGYTWYIDPLDGTNNFAHGFPVFAVSIALYAGERPLEAVVYDPTRDECFSALDKQGAFLRSGSVKKAIHVSQADSLINSLLATGFPDVRHDSEADNLAEFALPLGPG